MRSRSRAGNQTELAEAIRISADKLPAALLKVVRFVDQNRALSLATSAAELGRLTGTSDATVVRAAKAIGYAGLSDLRRALAAEMASGATAVENMDRTLRDLGTGAAHPIDLVLETHHASLLALQSDAARSQLRSAVEALNPAERIVVFGVGLSGPLARYMAMMLTRSGRATYVCDATGLAFADQLLELRSGDRLLLLAYGRAYPEVTAIIEEGVRRSLPIVLVTDSLERRLAQQATVIVTARRGETQQVALHAGTLAALEAVALGLSAADPDRAVAALRTLEDLRDRLISGS